MAGSSAFLDGVLRVLRGVADTALNNATRPGSDNAARRGDPRPTKPRTDGSRSAARPSVDGGDYPGDYDRLPDIVYSPRHDGEPDPGEIVWTWVPYEEDPTQGKDRPALIIGRDGGWLLALQVTSQDHDRDAEQEAEAGRFWVDIGTGAWDPQHRPSEARVNRIIRIDPDAVRRIGAVLDRPTFEAVAVEVRRHY
ncbi:type II toxin-antitoxin system PemK/MazF family toxin [Tessaracoccus palaemonis]|uniref:Type II toxin-antitoxin system PemK/MazF family toxin n=1 Tax=Tessaracoccus palaemonis TaxID=2829499 RepID=A0ABX8SGM7_9ACTN|nr:type II toxin-antitoxin system PemK/MazF family toxin [Tessaracoccus palaemonis]QXT62536.1 type II toxin-antitoxin system PemK/MazF family toxin [Tessaracoccus palaemonis]